MVIASIVILFFPSRGTYPQMFLGYQRRAIMFQGKEPFSWYDRHEHFVKVFYEMSSFGHMQFCQTKNHSYTFFPNLYIQSMFSDSVIFLSRFRLFSIRTRLWLKCLWSCTISRTCSRIFKHFYGKRQHRQSSQMVLSIGYVARVQAQGKKLSVNVFVALYIKLFCLLLCFISDS